MKAYAISLPRLTTRRASVVEQLARTQLDFEVVDGIDGYALTPQERAELLTEDGARAWRWLAPGAIGAALSHLRVYEQMTDDVALVVEDDVVLPSTIADLSRRVASEMHGREIVLLYFRSHEQCRFSAR